MPGAQYKISRFGSWTEILVESCLKTIAFTARIPREEDVGHDFFCVLSEVQGDLFKAGPSFTVQAKSNAEPLVFKKEHEINWLKELQNPFFLAVGNRDELRVDIYSTWARFNGFLRKAAKLIKLQPGPPTDGRSNPWTADDGSKQVIALGEPIIRAQMKDFMEEDRAKEFRDILWQWVMLDRQNIANTEIGLHWIIGPKNYMTNERLSLKEAILWTYYHAQNLERCELNFGRAATALRVTLRQAFDGKEEEIPIVAARTKALDGVLLAHWEILESVSQRALRKRVGLTPGDEPDVSSGETIFNSTQKGIQ